MIYFRIIEIKKEELSNVDLISSLFIKKYRIVLLFISRTLFSRVRICSLQ